MKIQAQHALLDTLLVSEKLKNDRALARELGIGSDRISKIRHGLPINDQVRVAIQRRFRWSLKRIDELAPPASAEE